MKRHHRRGTFRPRLEALEDRACPSCTASVAGGVLTITGDDLANDIAITDRAALGVRVACDGATTDFTQPIQRIAVNAGGGSDTVLYELEGPNLLRREMDFVLGAGDDSLGLFALDGLNNASGALLPVVRVLAGDGNDVVFVEIGDIHGRDITGGFAFVADLGAGDDSWIFFPDIRISGPVPVLFSVSGGDGDDEFGSGGLFRTDFGAVLTVAVDGGNGNDFFSSSTFPVLIAGDGTVNLTFSGGNGNDTFFNGEFLVRGAGTAVVSTFGGNGDDVMGGAYDLDVRANGIAVVNSLGGNGNDFMTDTFSGGVGANGALVYNADGGNDTDEMIADMGLLFLLSEPPPLIEVDGLDIAAGARVSFNMTGGNGDDQLFASYVGRLDGRLSMQIDGGLGNDQVLASLAINLLSRGQLSAQIRGTAGNDELDVRLLFYTSELRFVAGTGLVEVLTGISSTPAPLSARQVQADGGSGFDTCGFLGLVDVLNCEVVTPLTP